ncbi:MAG: cbb3-type cytochrome c oxidase subunit I [Rhodocyclaceae bacterium]|nr:cbb3-type cytochrome c oxidase subunit I [Rhodocyclaceae bacterium]
MNPIVSLLNPPPGPPRQLARAWLWLGIAALTLAGLLAILLGLSRTPSIQNVFPLRDFFKAALVVHVDLSVLIWFMAAAGVLWSLGGDHRLPRLGWSGFVLAAAGTGLIAVSPFFPQAEPLLNNYIPVLQQPVFFAGLLLAMCGFVLTTLRALLTCWPERIADCADSALRFGIFLSAIAGILAFAAFFASWLDTPEFQGQHYFEALFWGGGHTLQFQHTLLMTVAWLLLALHLESDMPLRPHVLAGCFGLAALPLLAVPLLYAMWPAGSPYHIAYFARLMESGHLFMLPLLAVAAKLLWQIRCIGAAAKSALLASFLLFAAGGILAFMIHGVNVVIPAHYHGSIVGVTLAFMGLAYVLLPRLGFAAPGPLARWQPYVYGIGQLTHITGLAIAGGYGVQRKVAGAEQVLVSLPQKIGMGLMGLGMGIAVIGGAMFVVICLRAMLRRAND